MIHGIILQNVEIFVYISFKEALSMVLLGCPLVTEIIHGAATEVLLHQLGWKVAIYPLQCWFDVKPNHLLTPKNKTNKQIDDPVYVWL